MGSCVSKKAARGGAAAKSKVAAPLPVAEKETTRALPPVAEAVDEEQEEEVKEVVLSEAPAPAPPPPPRPPLPEPVKPRQQPEADDEEEESAPSEACSASDGSASVESAAKAKLMHKMAGAEPEAEKKAAAAGAPRKGRKTPAAAPQEEKEGGKSRGSGAAAGNARARSPSPSSAHNRRQHHHPPPAARPRREQPAVVSGIGCRSGRFSPSAARRAAESAAAVRRTHSAREADMALPSTKRSLAAAINGLSRRGDAGERSGRRSDSPTGRRAPASPSLTHRPGTASPVRKAAKEHGTHERGRTRGRDGEEQPAVGGGERKKVEESALGQNPSVAMECFIFL